MPIWLFSDHQWHFLSTIHDVHYIHILKCRHLFSFLNDFFWRWYSLRFSYNISFLPLYLWRTLFIFLDLVVNCGFIFLKIFFDRMTLGIILSSLLTFQILNSLRHPTWFQFGQVFHILLDGLWFIPKYIIDIYYANGCIFRRWADYLVVVHHLIQQQQKIW